jgi:hypothetical protein
MKPPESAPPVDVEALEAFARGALYAADDALSRVRAWRPGGAPSGPPLQVEVPRLSLGDDRTEPLRWALEALLDDSHRFDAGGWRSHPDPAAERGPEGLQPEAVRRAWLDRMEVRVKEVERAVADVHNVLDLPFELEWLSRARALRESGRPGGA